MQHFAWKMVTGAQKHPSALVNFAVIATVHRLDNGVRLFVVWLGLYLHRDVEAMLAASFPFVREMLYE